MDQLFNSESVGLTGPSFGSSTCDKTLNPMASANNADESSCTTGVVLSPGPSCSYWASSIMEAEEPEVMGSKPSPSGVPQPSQFVVEAEGSANLGVEGTRPQELPYAATINEHRTKRRALYASIVSENVRLRHLNFQLGRKLNKLMDVKADNFRLQENSGQVLKANNTLASVMADCPRCTHVLGLVTYHQSSMPPPVVPAVPVTARGARSKRQASAQVSGAKRRAADLTESSVLSNCPESASAISTPWLPVDLSGETAEGSRSAIVMVLDQVQSDGEDFLTID